MHHDLAYCSCFALEATLYDVCLELLLHEVGNHLLTEIEKGWVVLALDLLRDVVLHEIVTILLLILWLLDDFIDDLLLNSRLLIAKCRGLVKRTYLKLV